MAAAFNASGRTFGSAVFCRARTERVINHWVEAQRRKLSKTVFRWSEIGAELLNVGCLKNRDSVKILPFENICPIAAQQVEEFMTANDARAAQILTDCYVVMVSNKSAQLKNLPLFQMSAEEIAAKDFVLSRIVQRALDMAERRRVPESLNGRDANIRANRQKWDRDHPWPEDGDEWKGLAVDCKIPYAEWKRSLIDTLIVPHVTSDMHVLEIAPGHGRWTETLLARAREVTAVDLSRNCLDHCRQRFLGRNIAFFLTDGASLPPELTASIDFLWSYDAFVHMAPAIVEAYLHRNRTRAETGRARNCPSFRCREPGCP
ncbi:MAG: class I SAM-dependent methyltransferase [Rhizomicrobium sp.]